MDDWEFWRYVEELRARHAAEDGDYWVYLSYWDVGKADSGPYKAVLHEASCTHVVNRKLRVEGLGYKNGWSAFETREKAHAFMAELHVRDNQLKSHPCRCVGRTF